MKMLDKRPQLIDKAREAPNLVIKEVFASDPQELFYVLKNWLHITLTTDNDAYEEASQRNTLMTFFQALQSLIVALGVLTFGMADKHFSVYYKGIDSDYDKFYLLTREQAANPKQVVKTFFNRFSILYIRRELSDWLEAGLEHSDNYPKEIKPINIFWAYMDVLCLVEAAYYAKADWEK